MIFCEPATVNDKDVRRIYLEGFPESERMPFLMMVAMSEFRNTQFLSFHDDDTLCGFIYLADSRELAFAMYFAVDEKLRSKGYGSAILQEIRSQNPDKKILVSVEPCEANVPDPEIRKRRKAFYLRNGYQETGYMLQLGGAVQEILISGGDFIEKELRSFFAFYSNGTMRPKIWRPEA